MECRYQTHLPLTWPRLMLLKIYWDIGWVLSPTCTSRWKSNYLQGWEDGSSARVIAGYNNSTPREGVATAEEDTEGRDVTATAVTTLDLTGMTQPMAGFMEWNDTTSGGVSMAKNLTRMGAMGACMYSTIARVKRKPTTSRRSSKAGKIMGRSYLSCYIPE